MEKCSCCFIGHRSIRDEMLVRVRVKAVVEDLLKKGVRIFNFGSRSAFDDLCHLLVTELQGSCPDLIRVNYRCKNEYAVKKEEKERLEERYESVVKKKTVLKDFEEEKISSRVMKAGRAAYVERNQEMIDESDYCVFYYIEEYARESNEYRKGGTKLAYEYAVSKEKKIINIVGVL